METHKHSIRNLDKDLILEARVYALQTGQTLGDLINCCLDQFLSEAEDEDQDAWEVAA